MAATTSRCKESRRLGPHLGGGGSKQTVRLRRSAIAEFDSSFSRLPRMVRSMLPVASAPTASFCAQTCGSPSTKPFQTPPSSSRPSISNRASCSGSSLSFWRRPRSPACAPTQQQFGQQHHCRQHHRPRADMVSSIVAQMSGHVNIAGAKASARR